MICKYRGNVQVKFYTDNSLRSVTYTETVAVNTTTYVVTVAGLSDSDFGAFTCDAYWNSDITHAPSEPATLQKLGNVLYLAHEESADMAVTLLR